MTDDGLLAMKDRVVIVTGAGSGIGAALCRKLHVDGARVVACDLAAYRNGIPEEADIALACDVTDIGQVKALAEAAVQRFGRIDGLVANAGILRDGTVADAPWAEIEQVFQVNLFGVLHCLRAVLPTMRRQGHGRLVVTTSRNAQLHRVRRMSYNASKAAVVSVVGTLANELQGTDILANCFIPGPTATGMHQSPGARAPESCYPTVRMLLGLPADGPSGKTFFDLKEIHILHRLDSESERTLVAQLDARH